MLLTPEVCLVFALALVLLLFVRLFTRFYIKQKLIKSIDYVSLSRFLSGCNDT